MVLDGSMDRLGLSQVLILANRRDMGHHRQVTDEQCACFVELFNSSHPSPDGSPRVRWANSSMRNAFGLRLIHLFFNIPFLCLQRETLKRQLETNKAEILSSYAELDCYQENPESAYDTFMEAVTQRRRQVAETMGAKSSSTDIAEGHGTGRMPIGGGQLIPGQQISPMINNPSATLVMSNPYSNSLPLSHPPEPDFMTSNNKLSLGFVSDGEAIDQFLADEERIDENRRPNKLKLSAEMIVASDEESCNVMVKTFEEDFNSDNELTEKMAKLTHEKSKYNDLKTNNQIAFMKSGGNNKKESAVVIPEVVTPTAYKVKIEENVIDSSEDNYDSPEKEESDGPIGFIATPWQNVPFSANSTPTHHSTDIVPTTTLAFSTADLDAWLAEDEPEPTDKSYKQLDISSDEDIGVKLPPHELKPFCAIVLSDVKLVEEGQQKKVRKTEGERDKKKKAKDSAGFRDDKNKKKKKSRPKDTSKSPRSTNKSSHNALEKFLDKDVEIDSYDPL